MKSRTVQATIVLGLLLKGANGSQAPIHSEPIVTGVGARALTPPAEIAQDLELKIGQRLDIRIDEPAERVRDAVADARIVS